MRNVATAYTVDVNSSVTTYQFIAQMYLTYQLVYPSKITSISQTFISRMYRAIPHDKIDSSPFLHGFVVLKC